jgi:hypothetical protein
VELLLATLLAIVPVFALLWFIHNFGVNVLYYDDWELVPLLQKSMSGTLTLADLFAQHNEHRMPFPFVIMLLVARMTRFNTIAQMYVSWGLLCITAYVMFLSVRKFLSPLSRSGVMLVLFPIFALLFSFRQFESILWAFTSQIYLMLLTVVLSFYLLSISQGLDRRFWFSCVSATVASYSYFNGILAWPAGLVLIFREGRSRRRVCCWLTLAALNYAAFFYGWIKPSYHPPWTFALIHPISGLVYFFTLIGAVLEGYNVSSAFGFGILISIIGLLVIVFSYKARILKQNRLWLSLILFALLSSLAEMIGRSGFGAWQALSSRYTPITVLGLIGLYLMASPALKIDRKVKRHLLRSFVAFGLITLMLVGLVIPYSEGWQLGQQWALARHRGAYELITLDLQSGQELATYLYPWPDVMKKRAAFLQQNGLGVFADQIDTSKLALVNSQTPHSLDTINGVIVSQHKSAIVINATRDSTITLTGWAVDALSNSSAFTVFITVDGKTDIPTMYGLPRPDVSMAYSNPSFRLSGFQAFFSSSAFGPGSHVVSLKVVAMDHSHYFYLQRVATYVIEY